MADVRPHPHDVIVHAVLSDVAEATGFPQVIRVPPSQAVRRMRGGWAENQRYEGCHNRMDFPRAMSRIFRRPSSTNLLQGLWRSGRAGG
jgi:hypothetical protein